MPSTFWAIRGLLYPARTGSRKYNTRKVMVMVSVKELRCATNWWYAAFLVLDELGWALTTVIETS
ncbi:hypothetical protein GCM10010841_00930 [Deinococcus aerophilus]|uniref:Uncharacterized protein n=1 Tax=Deinococcus aerophilus TaxID=522488 RepID=A0ABQ2GHW7_9DEIO|nr:hypothetical protein GCM10010841_00930 [Deinococcus aerophilus]